MKMNDRIKKLWVKALRSCKYKKGIGQLKTIDGRYCCLGVLTDLYLKETDGFIKDWEEDWELSKCVADWAGLDSSDPIPCRKKLSLINDEGKKSFNYIATIIEKYL